MLFKIRDVNRSATESRRLGHKLEPEHSKPVRLTPYPIKELTVSSWKIESATWMAEMGRIRVR